jgi:chemotaxis response regulator CheB
MMKIASQNSNPSPSVPEKSFLVVGIGASAGGIEALSQFFKQVPEKSGITYVVILHLSPTYESHLAQVLQPWCKLPVIKVTEKVLIEPDHVYVISPNHHLTIVDGYLEVTTNTSLEERRAPIDILFLTLGEMHGPMAIGVILSGTGANGSMGLKRIKEHGGTIFVQDPSEAEWKEMPRNAIATGFVDEVLPVAEIPAHIIAYQQSLEEIKIPAQMENQSSEQQALTNIFTQLQLRTGHDFSNYKKATLMRRIKRRIHIHTLGVCSILSYPSGGDTSTA